MADKPIDPRIERMLASLETFSAGLDAPLPELPGREDPASTRPGSPPPGRRPVSRRIPMPAQTPVWLPGPPETPPPQAHQKLTDAIDRLSARIVNLERKLSEREPPYMRSNVPPDEAQYGAAAASPPRREARAPDVRPPPALPLREAPREPAPKPEARPDQPAQQEPRESLSRTDTAPAHRPAERPAAAPPRRVPVLAPATLSLWLYFAAGALAMAGTLLLAKTTPWRRSPKPSAQRAAHPADSITFPAEKPVGLMASRGSYTSFDEKTLRLVRVDSNGKRVVSASGFPFQDTAGLSGGGDGIWTVNSFSAQITLHDPKTYEILSRFPAPGESPSAVHFDGTDLWTADLKTRRVYRHSIENGLMVAAESPVSEGRPVGLHRQGDQLWILDADTRSIGRYDIEGGLEPAGRASLRRYLPEDCSITGFAVQDGWVWLVTQNPSELHRIDARRLF